MGNKKDQVCPHDKHSPAMRHIPVQQLENAKKKKKGYIPELREGGDCVVKTDSVASGTSGSHILLAWLSTLSRVEMLRGRREGGNKV